MLEMLWKDMFREFLVLRIAPLVAGFNETNVSTSQDIFFRNNDDGFLATREIDSRITYLQHYKAVSFVPPPHYALI